MPQFPTNGQFGGGYPNNPQMRRRYLRRPGGNQGAGGMNYYQNLIGQFGGPQMVNTPQINQGQTNQYMQAGTQGINAPQISNQWQQYLGQVGNVNAPQMNNAQMNQYLRAGTQNINAAGLQDTSALLKSYDPILQQQQEQGFSQAAMRAGKTGMWGSPYAQALGAEAGKASNQRANISNQYLYQASEQAANRQLQAEIQNRQNQLQAAGLSAEQARAQASMELSANQGNQQAQMAQRQAQLQAAGMSAQQAQAQAQMELSAAQGNQQTGMAGAQLAGQMGSQQAQMQLQAQIQERQNQLQAAGLSAQQAQAQAQLEMQGQMANQSTNQQYYGQLLQGLGQAQNYNLGQGQLNLQQQQERNRQMQSMMEQFQGLYGDILPPDELWKFLQQSYGGGGYTIPQTGDIGQGYFGGNYGGWYGDGFSGWM